MELDLSRTSSLVWGLAPEIVLCLTALFVLLRGAGRRSGQAGDPALGRGSSAGWFALAGILVAAVANGWLYGVRPVGDGGAFVVDGLRLSANWILLAAAAGAVLLSFGYNYRNRLQVGEFHGLLLLATVGMMLMVAASDLMMLFLGLEVMSISVYAMAALDRRSRESAEAGIKYFLLGAFSTGFLLFGMALVYGATGSVELAAIADSVTSGTARGGFLTPGVLLVAVGFCFKVAVVPFHMWTPDVYEGSPAPVTAWMATAVKAATFLAFLRVFLVAFGSSPEAVELWRGVFWWLAAITMVAANVMALAQQNVKRMLAYSSIAHAGYLLVALVAGNEEGAAGLLFYLFVYAAMNLGAFAVVICVARQSEERLDVDDYCGLGRARPALATLLTVFLLSLAGFPGTGGFMAKMFVLQGAATAGLWSLVVVFLLTTAISYWYYLRVAWKMWMNSGREGAHDGVITPMPMRMALGACAAVVLVAGIFSGGLLEMAESGVRTLVSGFGQVGP